MSLKNKIMSELTEIAGEINDLAKQNETPGETSDISCSVRLFGEVKNNETGEIGQAFEFIIHYIKGGGEKTAQTAEDCVSFIVANDRLTAIVFERDRVGEAKVDIKLTEDSLRTFMGDVKAFALALLPSEPGTS